jgi:hypothetical protein
VSSHVLYAGRTGSGKTQGLIKSLKSCLDALKSLQRKNPELKLSTVILDPQSGEQSLAKSILPVLIGLGLWERVIYESLAATEFVLASQMLSPSDHPYPHQREKENEDRIHAFVSLLCRRKDVNGTHTLPLIEEWLTAALRMWLYQPSPLPLRWLPFCFLPASNEFLKMFTEHRTDSNQSYLNRLKWIEELVLYRRAPRNFHDHVAPAKRLIDAVFSVAFLLRCDGTWNLERALEEGKIIIIEGDPDNEDVTRTILGAVSLRTIQNAKDHTSPPVQVFFEEANNFGGIFGNAESAALSTKRQCNWRAIVSVQHFNFPSEEITASVMNNCAEQNYFCLGDPKTAELAAMKIGVPTLDFNRVLHTTDRRVRVGDEEAELDGRKILRGRYETETTEHRMPSHDQILERQSQLMQLDPGWRCQVKNGRVKGPYYEPMEGDRWTSKLKTKFARQLAKKRDKEKLDRLIAEMRRQPPFVSSGTLEAQWNSQISPANPQKALSSPPPSTVVPEDTVESDGSGIRWS